MLAGVGCGHGRRRRVWLAGRKVGRGLTGLDRACSFLLSPQRACYCCPIAPASPQSRPAGLNRRTGTCRLLRLRLGLASATWTRFHGGDRVILPQPPLAFGNLDSHSPSPPPSLSITLPLPEPRKRKNLHQHSVTAPTSGRSLSSTHTYFLSVRSVRGAFQLHDLTTNT